MSKKYALCIGINDYPGANSDLHGCVNDARDWSAALSASGFACQLLLDGNASGAGIRSSLVTLMNSAQSGDLIVVTFAGHGSFQPDLSGDEIDDVDECWCPHDVVAKGPITDDELHSILNTRQPNVRLVVISDSCHSGTITRFAQITTPPTARTGDAPQRLVRFLAPSTFRTDIPSRLSSDQWHRGDPPGQREALLMSACQDTEYAADAWFNGRPNGAFTFVALRELERLSRQATYQDWYKRIRQSLPSQQYPQTPNLFGSDAMMSWTALAAKDEGVRTESTLRRPHPPLSESGIVTARATGERLGAGAVEHASARRGSTPRAATIPLIAEGDSWFDFPWSDVLNSLEDNHGCDVASVARRGHTLEHMAYSKGQIGHFYRKLRKMHDRNQSPRAVLLSGGGNDLVGDEFGQVLNHKLSPNPGLNERVADAILYDRIWPAYETLIAAIMQVCRSVLDQHIPVLIHGYAYAVPDGRGIWNLGALLPGPWLLPEF